MNRKQKTTAAFTFVELMIILGVIAILATISIPFFIKASRASQNGAFVGDLRAARQAFILHSMEQGAYPPDVTPAILPGGMSPYLGNFAWTESTVIGGSWDWDYDVYGIKAGVSVHQPGALNSQLAQIDAIVDDGNLNSGTFRSRPSGYISIIE